MRPRIFILICCLFLFNLTQIYAQDENPKVQTEKSWAIGMVVRTATIPFATDEDRTVATLVPLIFYEGDRFYMRGIELGFKFYSIGDWQFSALGRMHFFDIPKSYQNRIQGDNVDWGFQARYQPFPLTYLDLELLSDWQKNVSSNARLALDLYQGGFHFDPYFELKLKGNSYNSTYFGLTQQEVKAGIDMSVGIIADYHVLSNFYFYGAARLTLLDRQVRRLDFVNRDVNANLLFGVGFSNDPTRPRKEELGIKPYIRLSHGWATPSDLANIIRFNATPDTANNQMTSIFYGQPLTDNLLGVPIEVYLTPGFAWHWASHVQRSCQELVIAVKLFYTFKWPIRWKFGAGEGLSWVNRIPFVEKSEMERKGYQPSNLLNFLDFSLDLNIGDIFGGDQMKKIWIGYGIHHRSAIFEKAQQFGRIRGGSNFQTIYLQYDL